MHKMAYKTVEGAQAMSENMYLLLMANGNLQPLVEKFHEHEGFYTGIGYAFPFKSEAFLKQIVAELPNAKIMKMPMGDKQTFHSLRQTFKAAYFREKCVEIERQLFSAKELVDIEEVSENCVQNLSIPEKKKNHLLGLIQEKERLKKAIAWAEGMEKVFLEQKSSIDIEFISEKKVNFFLEEAKEMPRLINYLDGTREKPLIRKGIVGMLVGAGGVGKTHALAQLAVSIITGIDWLEKYPVECVGHVFLGLGENAEDDIHRLLRKVVYSFSHKEMDLLEKNPFQAASQRFAISSFTGIDATFIHQEKPTPFYETFLTTLKSKEPDEGWSCIILDPISRFLGANAETDNAAATRFISLLERISLELKGHPTILFGHHMNKSGLSSRSTDQGAARGSSAITDGVRWQANLERLQTEENQEEESNTITLRYVKSNFTRVLPPQKLYKDEMGCLHAIDTQVLASMKPLKGKK